MVKVHVVSLLPNESVCQLWSGSIAAAARNRAAWQPAINMSWLVCTCCRYSPSSSARDMSHVLVTSVCTSIAQLLSKDGC